MEAGQSKKYGGGRYIEKNIVRGSKEKEREFPT